jgi:hypothetical protein
MGCKTCHDNHVYSAKAETQQELQKLLHELHQLLPGPQGQQRLLEFAHKWVDELPRDYRKELSRSGALRTRAPRDPVHYVDPLTNTKYFDPMNVNYARAFVLATGNNPHYNNGSMGDVFEAWLGISILKQKPGQCLDRVTEQQHALATFIERLCYTVYSISRLWFQIEDMAPLEWASRITQLFPQPGASSLVASAQQY